MSGIRKDYHEVVDGFFTGRVWKEGASNWSQADPPADESSSAPIRTFDTGATRNVDAGKPDYESFLSPAVLVEFGKYMNAHRKQADGTLRAGDNWQKGIPKDSYMSSMWRHFMDVWLHHRGIQPESGVTPMEALMALLFNVQGYAFELLRDET